MKDNQPLIVTLDFETYYDGEYSLGEMTTQEYIQDERFEIIGVSVAVGLDEPVWYDQAAGTEEILTALQATGRPLMIAAHNMVFDGSIIATHFPWFKVERHLCTLSMARSLGINVAAAGGSLDRLARYMRKQGVKVPNKGTEVVNARGKRYADFTKAALTAYIEYANTDVIICREAMWQMLPHLPAAELAWQDVAIRMHTHPTLALDRQTLEDDLVRVISRQEELTQEAMAATGTICEDDMLKALRSNQRFAGLLESRGVTPPMKVSPTTGKETYAFAKTDEGLQALLEHPDGLVRTLVESRLGTKSSIERTRLEKFIELSQFPALAVPVNISGATTHRLSGADSINLQNLPSGRVEGQSNAMRMAIIAAGEGRIVAAADSSQIEPRITAYAAGQDDLLEVFATGGDPYSVMASRVYGIPAEEILAGHRARDSKFTNMRQLGKALVLGCGYGMGHVRFQDSCRGQYGLELTVEEAKAAVGVYRHTNWAIVAFWKTCGQVLEHLMRGGEGYFGGPDGKLFYYGFRELLGERVAGVRLPDGMWLNYRNLRYHDFEYDGEVKREMAYDKVRGRRVSPERIFSTKLTENLIQALAFSLLKRQALRIANRYPVALNVHDEFATTAPEAEKSDVQAHLEESMKFVPKWLEGCPITCEVSAAREYGAC